MGFNVSDQGIKGWHKQGSGSRANCIRAMFDEADRRFWRSRSMHPPALPEGVDPAYKHYVKLCIRNGWLDEMIIVDGDEKAKKRKSDRK